MGLESTILCVDTSEYMRNGDYPPTRLSSMHDACNYLASAVINGNPESTVGVCNLGLASVLMSPTDNMGQVLAALNKVREGGRDETRRRGETRQDKTLPCALTLRTDLPCSPTCPVYLPALLTSLPSLPPSPPCLSSMTPLPPSLNPPSLTPPSLPAPLLLLHGPLHVPLRLHARSEAPPEQERSAAPRRFRRESHCRGREGEEREESGKDGGGSKHEERSENAQHELRAPQTLPPPFLFTCVCAPLTHSPYHSPSRPSSRLARRSRRATSEWTWCSWGSTTTTSPCSRRSSRRATRTTTGENCCWEAGRGRNGGAS